MDLNINLSEESYGGKKFRPRPSCYLEKSNQLLVCVTSWGPEDITKIVFDSIKNFIATANEDHEATRPFNSKQNLDPIGNTLRMAIILASERIFKEYNQNEYAAGFEVFAAIRQGHQWTYISCGQPSLILSSKTLGILPINYSMDLNLLVPKNPLTDPLPNQMLGLGQHPPIQYGSLRVHPTDQFLLASRICLPSSFFSMDRRNFNMSSIRKILSEDNSEIPFWLGLIDFD